MVASFLRLFLVVLALSCSVSAVKLEYTQFFPECSFEDKGLSLTSVVRCGSYLLLPNAHLGAGYDLVVTSFVDGVKMLWDYELTLALGLLSPLMPSSIVAGIAGNPDPLAFLDRKSVV